MNLRRILAVTITLAFLAVPAMAQATGGKGKAKGKPGFTPKPRKGGVSFEPPEQDPPSDPAPDSTKSQDPPATPKSDIELLLEQLSSWPSKSSREALRRALPRYESRKDELLATLKARPIQSARNPRLVAALCHLVAEAGDREQVPNVIAVLRDPIVFSRGADIIEALVRLDPVHARENLLPLLSVKSSHVVNEVAKRLSPLLRPEDAAALLAMAGDQSAATRRAALGLAAEADFEASKDALIEALGDKNASVAASAAMTLGFRADESGLAQLNHLVRGPETRRAAFSVLALVRAGERRGKHAFDDASIAALIGTRGLSSINPTTRVLGAVALADIGYFEPVPSVDPVLDSEVVPALLGAVSGMQFFSDLTVLKPIALDRLRRLTEGTEDLRSAIDWSHWWDRHREGFVAHRALNSIPGSVRATLSVTLEGRHIGDRRRLTVSARAADAPADGGAGGRFVALRPEQVDRLAEAIRTAKILAVPEAIGDSPDIPELEITLAAAKRRRILRVDSDLVVPEDLVTFVATVDALRAENEWQRYWDRRIAPTFAAFVENETPFWTDTNIADEDKAIRKIRLAVGSIVDLLSEEDRVQALAAIAMEPMLGKALRPEEGRILASFAAVGVDLSMTGEACLRVLANAGRSEGLSALRARVNAPGGDVSAEELLLDTLANAPLDAVLAAAGGDEPTAIKRAALRALGGRSDPQAIAAVREGLGSDDPGIRGAAYASYGRQRADDGFLVLSHAARDEGDVRAVMGALEGLGHLGGREVLEALGLALGSSDPRSRAAAIRGLAATREPEALSLILSLLTTDPDAAVREEASRAVQDVGGDRAREALRSIALDRRQKVETRRRSVEGLGTLGAAKSRGDLRALLGDPEHVVADMAAFVLAWIRDEEATPRLLATLRAGRSPARTMRSLELLSLESFRESRRRDEIAGLYSGWYEVSRALGARGWLAEALRVRGHGSEPLDAWAKGGNARPAVPMFLRVLKDDAWYLRRAVDIELRGVSGLDFGDVDPWTPPEKMSAIAASWQEWWGKASR